jgi:hypothetical protein
MLDGQPLDRTRPPQATPFVTFWRALLGYIASVSSAALMFFPWLDVIHAVRGEKMMLFQSATIMSVQGTDRFLRVELGTVLGALVFASMWVLPMYAVGMVLARLLGVRRWTYFVALGIALVVTLPYVISAPHIPFSLLGNRRISMQFSVVTIPLGIIGGAVCWLVLRATYRDNSKRSNVPR